MTLLILWEPVWVRSSRLSSSVMPSSCDSRQAGVSGVGRPAYTVSRVSSRWRNSGSSQASRNAASISWQAGISDSGTYRPP